MKKTMLLSLALFLCICCSFAGTIVVGTKTCPVELVIRELSLYQQSMQLLKSNTFKPKFLNYNQYGAIINADLQSVVLTCDPKLGTITDKGELIASGVADGVLTATYKGL